MFIFTSLTHSQNSFNKYISVPHQDQPKTFLDVIFNVAENTNGIKIALKQKGEVVVEKPLKAKVEEDTSKKGNRIVSLRESDRGDRFFVYLDLLDYDSKIQISVYNMLGKKVMDVFDNYPYKDTNYPYEINTSSPINLPNGLYLCIVLGKNYRLREKFIISKH